LSDAASSDTDLFWFLEWSCKGDGWAHPKDCARASLWKSAVRAPLMMTRFVRMWWMAYFTRNVSVLNACWPGSQKERPERKVGAIRTSLVSSPLKDDDPPMNETNTGRMCCKGARFPSGVFEARERGVSCVLVTCHTSMPRYFLSQQQCRRWWYWWLKCWDISNQPLI
jgi:hypothetical protein